MHCLQLLLRAAIPKLLHLCCHVLQQRGQRLQQRLQQRGTRQRKTIRVVGKQMKPPESAMPLACQNIKRDTIKHRVYMLTSASRLSLAASWYCSSATATAICLQGVQCGVQDQIQAERDEPSNGVQIHYPLMQKGHIFLNASLAGGCAWAQHTRLTVSPDATEPRPLRGEWWVHLLLSPCLNRCLWK